MNRVKKITLFFLIPFIIFNLWIYNDNYKTYVIKAPKVLQEARKEFVNAYIFHIYYGFAVKTLRFDFQSFWLAPLRELRNHYYEKGISKLPKNESEAAIWFSIFKINPYNFTVKGRYGGLFLNYDKKFAQKFLDEVYENMRIFSLNNFADKNSKFVSTSLEDYLDLNNIYIKDINKTNNNNHFNDENIIRISLDKKLNQKLINIFQWNTKVLKYHKKNFSIQYNRILNQKQGTRSPYFHYLIKSYELSSFILFYKIKNNTFTCNDDKKYYVEHYNNKIRLINYANTHKFTDVQKNSVANIIIDLRIENKSFKNLIDVKSNNPLKLVIDCSYKTNK